MHCLCLLLYLSFFRVSLSSAAAVVSSMLYLSLSLSISWVGVKLEHTILVLIFFFRTCGIVCTGADNGKHVACVLTKSGGGGWRWWWWWWWWWRWHWWWWKWQFARFNHVLLFNLPIIWLMRSVFVCVRVFYRAIPFMKLFFLSILCSRVIPEQNSYYAMKFQKCAAQTIFSVFFNTLTTYFGLFFECFYFVDSSDCCTCFRQLKKKTLAADRSIVINH